MKAGSYQVYVGAKCVSHSTDQAKETNAFWQFSNENPNKAVFLAKTEVLATNSLAAIAIQVQAK